jgi:deoxyribodipyrimidine photo-lyase
VIAPTRPRALIWFRRDLRLADHAALDAALVAGFDPVPIYVHAPDEEAPWVPGAASRWWLHRSLAALDRELRERGSQLTVCRGDSAAQIDRLLAATGASAIFWTRLYDPSIVRRDASIKERLRARGIAAVSVPGDVLNEPWQVKNCSGDPYRVFTPYWRNASAQLADARTLPASMSLPANPVPGLALDALDLLPRSGWDAGLQAYWTPGEHGARQALDAFIDSALEDYAGARDLPDRVGTSRLSPHLHFGEITPRQILGRLHADTSPGRRALAEPFVRQLGWRDFGLQLLFHFPHTSEDPLQPAFANFPWAEVDPALLAAWQHGRTGVPIVDAGMRELWSTGWMHNRVRMLVASFLTKNLRYHWLEGARWFWDTLVDADLANNTQGWQWTAGSGADAAPYFRIFNPVTQGERFDPKGDYVRRWVPELAGLSAKFIHQPWSAGGVHGYPAPIVDLKSSRDEALAAYGQMRA